MILNITLLLTIAVVAVQSYKFVVFTSPRLGNFRDLSGLILGLVNFRHDVYLVTSSDNLTTPELIDIQRLRYINYESKSESPFDEEQRYKYIFSNDQYSLDKHDSETINYDCQETLSQELDILDEIKTEQIHAAIVDADFPCYYHMVTKLGLPYVSVASSSMPWLMQTHPFMTHPCYSVAENSLFFRMRSLWNFIRSPDHELASRSAIWLWNTNGIIDCAGPTTSNVLQVGGLSHREERPLPGAVDDLANKAKFGVVLFSLPGIQYSPKHVDKFLDAFEQLDQLVLWRTSDVFERILPQNVLTTSLIPECDILAHANVKLVITDGENSRQMEALFHGVPVISMPMTARQVYNADRLAIKGHGRKLDLDFSSEDLVEMITEMLNDGALNERVRNTSVLLKGSPDNRYIAVYWLDLITKFGAEHLKPIALSKFEFLMLDLFVIVGFLCTIISFMLAFLVHYLVKKSSDRKRKSGEISKKQEVKKVAHAQTPETVAKPETTSTQSANTKTNHSNPEIRLRHQDSKKQKKKKNKQ